MTNEVTTTIDADRCIGCGDCVAVCPSETLALRDDIAVVVGDSSLQCGHCVAVCPSDAIEVAALDPQAWRFDTFELNHNWLPHGQGNLAELVRLMASRRSCRNYTEQPVDRVQLDDLIRIGTTAPSGTNSQAWTFTLLPDRAAVLRLSQWVSVFFRRLNSLAKKAWLAGALKWVGKPELQHYRLGYMDDVEEALRSWDEEKVDRLFHGASAALLVGSLRGASCPAEDAVLASQNILLAAHSMGLGTCLIGFVVEAMRNDARIGRALGLLKGERIHTVIALGHPAEQYRTVTGRRTLSPRVLTADDIAEP